VYISAVTGEGEMRTNGEGISGKREGELLAQVKFSSGFSSHQEDAEAFISFSQLILIKPVAGRGAGCDV
jgi:hypothetical protein